MSADATRVTPSTVRASFRKDVLATDTISVQFTRVIANYVTPLFFNSGWSANGVTALRIVFSFLTLAALIHGQSAYVIAAIAGFYVVYVLDCVDGSISRLRQSASYWGKYIDGLSDNILASLSPVAAGLGLWMVGEAAWPALLGAITTILALANQAARYRLSFFREWMVSHTGPLRPEDEIARAPLVSFELTLSRSWINFNFVTPLLLVFGAETYVISMAIICIPIDLLWTTSTILHASRILRRQRKSKYSH